MKWLIWAVLSALFAGGTAILAKLGVAGVDANLAMAIRTTVVLVFAWLAVGLSNSPSWQHLTPQNWWFLFYSGLATGASWYCYFRALQSGPASLVAPVDKLSVVVVMILGVCILGEKLSPHQVAGGILVLLGIGLLTIK